MLCLSGFELYSRWVPLRIANRQQHRDNIPATTPVQYSQRSLCIPLMDHLIAQIDPTSVKAR